MFLLTVDRLFDNLQHMSLQTAADRLLATQHLHAKNHSLSTVASPSLGDHRNDSY